MPQTQMYLPMLMLDLREHFRSLRSRHSTLSPSAQVVLLYALLRRSEVLMPLDMAHILGYSAIASGSHPGS